MRINNLFCTGRGIFVISLVPKRVTVNLERVLEKCSRIGGLFDKLLIFRGVSCHASDF